MGTLRNEAARTSVVLVGVDFSENSMFALRAAENLARAAPAAELHLAHSFAAPISLRASADGGDAAQIATIDDPAIARAELDKLVRHAIPGISRVTGHLRMGPPAAMLVKLASDLSADLIVVGTHGRTGIDRLMFGSVAEKVVRTAPCPVLTVRPKTVPAWEQIEPPCPECLAVQRETGGAQLWCETHSVHHPRAHTYHESPLSYGIGAQTFRAD
jgi:nucleotide-binding universal stress UspA family protein